MQSYIPSTWVMSNIGDIADIVSGGTPKAGDESNFSEPGTGFAWLTPADLSGYTAKYISHGNRDLSEKGLATSSAKLMPAGTLLFSSRAPIGYVAIAENEISTNQGFKNFVFSDDIVPTYAYFYLKSIRGLAESLGTGTTFKEISGATAKTLPFVIPPLAEQKEIADRLDKLLAQVEATQTRLARIPDIIKRFRQSVLAAAVSGKLTEEWRKGSSLWQKLIIDNLAQVKGGKRLPQGEELVENDTGFPYIRAGQLKQGTVISNGDARTKQLYLTASAHAKISRYIVEENDVYLTIVGASIGDAGLIPSHYHGANLTENAAKITGFKKPFSSKFLAYWLRSPALQEIIQLEIKSGAQGKLALKRIKELPVPYPKLEEQTEIVRRVEQLFAYADTIEQQAKTAKERVDKLTQAILAKAFRGELTADWRAANPDLISGDNSAAALLARIQAERAAAKPRKNRRV